MLLSGFEALTEEEQAQFDRLREEVQWEECENLFRIACLIDDWWRKKHRREIEWYIRNRGDIAG